MLCFVIIALSKNYTVENKLKIKLKLLINYEFFHENDTCPFPTHVTIVRNKVRKERECRGSRKK